MENEKRNLSNAEETALVSSASSLIGGFAIGGPVGMLAGLAVGLFCSCVGQNVRDSLSENEE
jgi:hypothetical protein